MTCQQWDCMQCDRSQVAGRVKTRTFMAPYRGMVKPINRMSGMSSTRRAACPHNGSLIIIISIIISIYRSGQSPWHFRFSCTSSLNKGDASRRNETKKMLPSQFPRRQLDCNFCVCSNCELTKTNCSP